MKILVGLLFFLSAISAHKNVTKPLKLLLKKNGQPAKDKNGKPIPIRPSAAASGTENVVYHNWPLLYTATVHLVFWGPSQSNRVQDTQFYNDILPSSFLPWASPEYSQPGKPINAPTALASVRDVLGYLGDSKKKRQY